MKFALGAAIGLASLVAALGAQGGTRAVPRGFDPESLAATNGADVWLLGSYPCGSLTGWCTAIVRTTDGGRTWARVNAPALPTQGDVPTLRFADARDGFVFVGNLFYATHDGGTSWRRVKLGEVFSVAMSDGRAVAVTARSVEASSVSGNVWRPLAVRLAPVSVALLGQDIWVLGTRSGEKLARSNDGGKTFTVGTGPCYPGLGGQIEPASNDVLWAVCPTGMLAGASRSTDGGHSFERVTIPRCCINAMRLVALSPLVALVSPGAPGRPTFLWTTDGGRTWSSARTPASAESVFSLEFVDSGVGLALVQLTGEHQAMWRSADSGKSWSAVKVR